LYRSYLGLTGQTKFIKYCGSVGFVKGEAAYDSLLCYDNTVKKIRYAKFLKKHMRQLRRHLPGPRDWLLLAMGAMLAFIGMKAANLAGQAHTPLSPESGKVTISWLPDSVKRWSVPMEAMGKKYDIDPNVLAILMTMESGGNPKAHSEADAQGLLQVTPPTGKDIAAKFLKKPMTHYDLYDPQTNIEFSAAYLSYLRDTFGTTQQGPDWNVTVELIAAGYNGGPGAAASLEKGEGLHDPQTIMYSRDAYNMWRERHASASPTFERWKERGGSNLLIRAQQP